MKKTITYGSVCSGIEAVSVAVKPLGWEAVWLAEIEPNPCMTLHHHYDSGRPLYMPDPDERDLDDDDRDARRAAIRAVAWLPLRTTGPRNLGDFTRIANLVRNGLVSAPDVLVGGTPCQAFSIAGLRAGLSDARGALTIAFVELANAIDTTRSIRGDDPAVIWWENVPGVLSSKDNAFGCFIGALAGEDCELVAPGGKWPNAGVVFGPQRTVAWRVTDAQYFGVAQRRRRVFVVASAREGFDPAEVLLEFDGVRRDSAPSRESGEDAAATVRASAGRRGGVQDECGLGLQPVACLDASYGRLQGCSGQDANHGHSHLVPLSVALRGRDGGATAELGDDIAGTLRASGGGGGDKAHVLAPVISGPVARSVERPRGDGLDTLITQSPPCNTQLGPIAFDSRQDCVSSTEVFGALGSSSPQAQAVCITGDITHTLKAEGFDASEDGTGRGQPIVTSFLHLNKGRPDGRKSAHEQMVSVKDHVPTLTTGGAPGAVHTGMAVRRLTPRECERLQSFPDDYTLVPIRKVTKARAEAILAAGDPAVLIGDQWWKQSADGPRYKALGNSMCVFNMAWIGRRIDSQLCDISGLNSATNTKKASE